MLVEISGPPSLQVEDYGLLQFGFKGEMMSHKNDATSSATVRSTVILLGCLVVMNAQAVQPWSDGVKPLIDRLAEIDQALSWNVAESMSEFLTALDVTRLKHEKSALLLQRGKLADLLKLSSEVAESGLVSYAVPVRESLSSSLDTDAARRSASR
ncbi:MAG: hypothetical protein JWM42_2934 [Burkholderia sp.]|nr:hypothetical protein [Burkholderia sp.]